MSQHNDHQTDESLDLPPFTALPHVLPRYFSLRGSPTLPPSLYDPEISTEDSRKVSIDLETFFDEDTTPLLSTIFDSEKRKEKTLHQESVSNELRPGLSNTRVFFREDLSLVRAAEYVLSRDQETITPLRGAKPDQSYHQAWNFLLNATPHLPLSVSRCIFIRYLRTYPLKHTVRAVWLRRELNTLKRKNLGVDKKIFEGILCLSVNETSPHSSSPFDSALKKNAPVLFPISFNTTHSLHYLCHELALWLCGSYNLPLWEVYLDFYDLAFSTRKKKLELEILRRALNETGFHPCSTPLWYRLLDLEIEELRGLPGSFSKTHYEGLFSSLCGVSRHRSTP